MLTSQSSCVDSFHFQAGTQAPSSKAPRPTPQTGQRAPQDVRRQTGRDSLSRNRKLVGRQKVREFEYARTVVGNLVESNRLQNVCAAERIGHVLTRIPSFSPFPFPILLFSSFCFLLSLLLFSTSPSSSPVYSSSYSSLSSSSPS